MERVSQRRTVTQAIPLAFAEKSSTKNSAFRTNDKTPCPGGEGVSREPRFNATLARRGIDDRFYANGSAASIKICRKSASSKPSP